MAGNGVPGNDAPVNDVPGNDVPDEPCREILTLSTYDNNMSSDPESVIPDTEVLQPSVWKGVLKRLG